MSDFIRSIPGFLNSYSGLLLAMLTTVYVFLTFKISKSNSNLIKIMKEENERSMRPYIHISLDEKPDIMVFLKIKNVGRSAATGVIFEIEEDLKLYGTLDKIKDIPIFKEGIIFFPPEAEYYINIGRFGQFFNKNDKPSEFPNVVKIKCKYYYQDKSFKEESIIDIKSHYGTTFTSNSIAKEISELRSNIGKEFNELNSHIGYFKMKDMSKIKQNRSKKKPKVTNKNKA